MFDLGPHAAFIIAAYGVTLLAVGALSLVTIGDDMEQRRKLAALERKGVRRRSAAKPKPAATGTKTEAAKPAPTETPAKRKPTRKRRTP